MISWSFSINSVCIASQSCSVIPPDHINVRQAGVYNNFSLKFPDPKSLQGKLDEIELIYEFTPSESVNQWMARFNFT